VDIAEIKQDVKKVLGIDIEGKDVREEIQGALSKIDASLLLFILSTGFGKSKIALNSVLGNNILIVHKQLPHKASWVKEIKKWDFDYNVVYSTYNSLYKLEGKHFDTIILDEIHGGLTDNRKDSIHGLSWDKLICLSATVPDDKLKQLYEFGKPKIIRIPIAKSIQWGITPIPKITVIDYALNNTNRNQLYIKGKDSKKKDLVIEYQDRFKYFGNREFNIQIKCSEQEYHELLVQDVEYWKSRFFKEKETYQKNKWLKLGLDRKNWLNHLKTNFAKQIISKLGRKRLIVFTTDIKQCEVLGGNRKGLVHSKNPDSLQLIDDFNSKKINSLFAINMLSESVNLVELDVALMVNLDGSDIMSIQKVGRAVRSVNPIIYIIRIPFTRDAEYFKNLKEELGDSYFEYKKLSEI